MSFRFVSMAALAVLALAGCGKDVSYGPSPEYLTQGGTGDGGGGTGTTGTGGASGASGMSGSSGATGTTGANGTCANPVSWSLLQPHPTENHSVDLLLVVDTSGSMDDKRARIAATLPTFVSQLPAGTDYRVAVMLAHGGASHYSGRLFSAHGVPAVLDSAAQTPQAIQLGLEKTLAMVIDDVDEAEGEMGMYSILRSQHADRLAEIQAQGFFRDEAALSVLFVTDENDICFPPQLHGYTRFPDYVPSPGDVEMVAYRRYCLNPDGSERITPARVVSDLTRFKGAEKLSLGGLIHVDPSMVPQACGKEDSIGHGILELVQSLPDGVTFEIAKNDYVPGLAKLGSVVSSQLLLHTAFTLNGSGVLAPRSLLVRVDGKTLNDAIYDPSQRVVRIPKDDAGHAGSVVSISACLL